MDKDYTLQHILADPELKTDFMVFLTSRWCDENMLFYDAVQVYRSLDAEKRKRKAEEIAEFYLKVNAVKEINVDSMQRSLVLKTMATAEELPEDMFDDCLDSCLGMLQPLVSKWRIARAEGQISPHSNPATTRLDRKLGDVLASLPLIGRGDVKAETAARPSVPNRTRTNSEDSGIVAMSQWNRQVESPLLQKMREEALTLEKEKVGAQEKVQKTKASNAELERLKISLEKQREEDLKILTQLEEDLYIAQVEKAEWSARLYEVEQQHSHLFINLREARNLLKD